VRRQVHPQRAMGRDIAVSIAVKFAESALQLEMLGLPEQHRPNPIMEVLDRLRRPRKVVRLEDTRRIASLSNRAVGRTGSDHAEMATRRRQGTSSTVGNKVQSRWSTSCMC
jgi:hypothetical protein